MRAEPERLLMLTFWTVLVAVLFIALINGPAGLILAGAIIMFVALAVPVEMRREHVRRHQYRAWGDRHANR